MADMAPGFLTYVEFFERLGGDELAQCDIAYGYEWGKSGFAKDFAAAEYWYLKAARKGNAMAQGNLGNIYREDAVCKKALYWLEKSASQKLPVAMLSLADCLRCPRCPAMDIVRDAQLEFEGNKLKQQDFNPDPLRIRV